MKKFVKENPSAIVIIVTILILIYIVAFGKGDKIVSAQSLERMTSGLIVDGNSVSGQFVPQYNDLKGISIILNCDTDQVSGNATLSLYNEYGELVASDSEVLKDISFGYMHEFPMDVELTPGNVYTYEITADSYGEHPVSVEMVTASCGTGEVQSFMQGGVFYDNTILLTQCRYHAPLSKKAMIPYVFLTCILSIILIWAVEDKKHISNVAKIATYSLFIISGVLFFILNDEGSQPLSFKGIELNHEVGYDDYRGYLSINEDSGYNGLLASTDPYILNKGTYRINLSYLTGGDSNTIEVYNDGVQVSLDTIPFGNTYNTSEFTLDNDSQNVEIRIYYAGAGILKINNIEICPDGYFYYDNYLFLALFIIVNAVLLLLYRRHKKQPFSTQSIIDTCIVIGVAIFATIPFMTTKLTNADDLCYHLLRIEGLKDGILDGQIPVNILPNAKSGNGYLNSMYPYLFLYISAFLRICRISLSLSYKFLIFVANISTAAVTYISVKSICKKRYAYILATVLYVLMPYRYTNIYARGALGETLAMTFWPLIIAGIYHVFIGDKKKWPYLCIGFTGIIQSHILSALMGVIFALVAGLVFIRNLFRDKRYIELIKAAGIALLVNLWFIVPFVYYYLNEDLAMNVLELGSFAIFSVNPLNLVSMLRLNGSRYYSYGIPIVFCFAVGIMHIILSFVNKEDDSEDEDQRKVFINLLTIMAVLLTIIVTGYNAAERFMEIPLLKKLFTTIQFPWRLIGPAAIMIIMASSVIMAESEILKTKNINTILFALLISMNVFTGMMEYNDTEFYAYESFDDTYTAGHVTKVMGIVPFKDSISYPYEWRLNDVGDDVYFTTPVLTDYENATIDDYYKNGTNVKLTYTEPNEEGEVIIPIMAYKGYHVYDENGNELEFRLQDKYAITIPLVGDNQQHTIFVNYEQRGAFIIATLISSLTIILLIVGSIYINIKKEKGVQ